MLIFDDNDHRDPNDIDNDHSDPHDCKIFFPAETLRLLPSGRYSDRISWSMITDPGARGPGLRGRGHRGDTLTLQIQSSSLVSSALSYSSSVIDTSVIITLIVNRSLSQQVSQRSQLFSCMRTSYSSSSSSSSLHSSSSQCLSCPRLGWSPATIREPVTPEPDWARPILGRAGLPASLCRRRIFCEKLARK